MECIKFLQVTGMSLNMLGVILLAFFAVPAHTLNKQGTDGLELISDSDSKKKNIKRYYMYFSITLFAYALLFLGFAFQLYAVFV
ncbi:TPA: hypothetical protein ACGVBR_004358 [Vibrio vulnificus]